MSVTWLTFLSDFGFEDAFLGVCKGVIARTAPEVRVLDVLHLVHPQDVEQGAAVLASAVPTCRSRRCTSRSSTRSGPARCGASPCAPPTAPRSSRRTTG